LIHLYRCNNNYATGQAHSDIFLQICLIASCSTARGEARLLPSHTASSPPISGLKRAGVRSTILQSIT
jgi:hypothetical protein